MVKLLSLPCIGFTQPILHQTNNQINNRDLFYQQLNQAIVNPEYMLNHWIELPISPKVKNIKTQQLSLREAILLALRYNPNIQNAELDRIIQRYKLRLANNEFELQYALSGNASINNNHFSGVGSTSNHSYIATPTLDLKTKQGTQFSLQLDNNVSMYNNYIPVLKASLTQPLLRGFGLSANELGLLNAIDMEQLNKINLRQTIIDQITQVISIYRALILRGNNLQNQKRQLQEAEQLFAINKQKIEAGQLEPTGNIQQSYQIESLKLMVEQAENDFKTYGQDLLQTIGLDPYRHLAVPNDVTVNAVIVPDLKKSIAIALAHNSQYLAQMMIVRANERAYMATKNQQLWQLDLKAEVTSGTTTNVDNSNIGLRGIYNGHNIAESASLNMTIPFHDLQRRSYLINAKVELEKARLNLTTTRRRLITQITNTINAIQSQAKRYQLAEKQVKLAEQSYELEKKKQQAGISTSLDVNNTQNQLIQAEAGLIGAKISYLEQLSALQQLLGTTLEEWQIKLQFGS